MRRVFLRRTRGHSNAPYLAKKHENLPGLQDLADFLHEAKYSYKKTEKVNPKGDEEKILYLFRYLMKPFKYSETACQANTLALIKLEVMLLYK